MPATCWATEAKSCTEIALALGWPSQRMLREARACAGSRRATIAASRRWDSFSQTSSDLDPKLDPMGATQAPIGHHRTKQTPAVFDQFPYRTTLEATRANEVVRFLQPVTMTTPVASATVTIFNRIKSGSNGWGMEAGNVSRDGIVPQVIQSRLLTCWNNRPRPAACGFGCA